MPRIFRPYVTSKKPSARTAVAIGNFDGLHPGHMAILNAAKATGLAPAVLTFEPHPSRLFRPDAHAPRLYPLAGKLRLLEQAGIDTVFLQQFNKRFAATTAEAFVNDYLTALNAGHVIVGEDFTFGHKRGGNTELLKTLCAKHGIGVTLVKPALCKDGTPYSSTRIRQHIANGEFEKTAALLGRDHEIRARIRHGQKLGRELGYPTLNMHWPEGLATPPYGIYAGFVNGTPAAISYGIRPTVTDDKTAVLEAHLLDTSKAMAAYGERAHVVIRAYLRPEAKFDSLEALKDQIAKDCALARDILNRKP